MIAVLGENWNVETQTVKTNKGTDLSQQMYAKEKLRRAWL